MNTGDNNTGCAGNIPSKLEFSFHSLDLLIGTEVYTTLNNWLPAYGVTFCFANVVFTTDFADTAERMIYETLAHDMNRPAMKQNCDIYF